MPRTGVPHNARRQARAAGMALDTYLAFLETHKWCSRCKTMHERSEFGRDAHTSDGLAGSCRVSRNGHPDHDTQTNRPRGRRYTEARDGDEKQARQRVNYLVTMGLLPDPDEIACVDCGHERAEGGPRHEHDHHKGYAAEYHDDVEVVCAPCHCAREIKRGVHQASRNAEYERSRDGRFRKAAS